MADVPSSLSPAHVLEEMVEHGQLCLADFKAKITGAESAGETPPFCKSVEVSGIDNLVGSYTLTLHIENGRSTITAAHQHE